MLLFPKDDDYLCRYTIKKCHSEKIVSDDSWENNMIELLPNNTDIYDKIINLAPLRIITLWR